MDLFFKTETFTFPTNRLLCLKTKHFIARLTVYRNLIPLFGLDSIFTYSSTSDNIFWELGLQAIF
ncbi:MAG: hypothetical protein KBF99_06075 [Leptospiraceae bacterium]|nr:hypothetical protein [Leptospiraceae bacterium]